MLAACCLLHTIALDYAAQRSDALMYCRCTGCGRPAHEECWAAHLHQDAQGARLLAGAVLPQHGSCPACGRQLTWLEVLVNAKAIPVRRAHRERKARGKAATGAAASQQANSTTFDAAQSQGADWAAASSTQATKGRKRAASAARGRGRGRGSAGARRPATRIPDAGDSADIASEGQSADACAANAHALHASQSAPAALQPSSGKLPARLAGGPSHARRGRIAAAAARGAAPSAGTHGAADVLQSMQALQPLSLDSGDDCALQSQEPPAWADCPEPPASDSCMSAGQSPAACSPHMQGEHADTAQHDELFDSLSGLHALPMAAHDGPEPPLSEDEDAHAHLRSSAHCLQEGLCALQEPQPGTARELPELATPSSLCSPAASPQHAHECASPQWSPGPLSDPRLYDAPDSAQMLVDAAHCNTHSEPDHEHSCSSADQNRNVQPGHNHEQHATRAHAEATMRLGTTAADSPVQQAMLSPKAVDATAQQRSCIDLAATPVAKMHANAPGLSPEPMSCSPLLSHSPAQRSRDHGHQQRNPLGRVPPQGVSASPEASAAQPMMSARLTFAQACTTDAVAARSAQGGGQAASGRTASMLCDLSNGHKRSTSARSGVAASKGGDEVVWPVLRCAAGMRSSAQLAMGVPDEAASPLRSMQIDLT